MHRISDYLYFKTCCRVFCSTAVAAFLLFGCEKPYTDLETSTKHNSSHIGDKKGTDSLNTQREMFLFKNDTASFYVASLELYPLQYDDISRLYQSICRRILPYRLPTKSESLLLRRHTLPNGWWGGKRCLCVDNIGERGYETHTFYSFRWGGGTVAPIGIRTQYAVKPIRTQRFTSEERSSSIDINDKWKHNYYIDF